MRNLFILIGTLLCIHAFSATITPSGVLTNGFCKHGYTVQLSTTGLTAPVTFSLTAGSLPPGVTLSTAGLIQGFITTTADAAYTFTLSAKGTGTVVATSTNTINVTAITNATLEQMWKYWTNPAYPTSSQVFDTWSSLLNGVNSNLTPPYYKDSIVSSGNYSMFVGNHNTGSGGDFEGYGHAWLFEADISPFGVNDTSKTIVTFGPIDWGIATNNTGFTGGNSGLQGFTRYMRVFGSDSVKTSGGTTDATVKTGSLTIANGDLSLLTAGKTLKVKGGANTKLNSFSIAGASAAVTNTVVTANSIIFLQEAGATTPVAYSVTGITPGASFTVTPATSHTATVNYFIIEKQ